MKSHLSGAALTVAVAPFQSACSLAIPPLQSVEVSYQPGNALTTADIDSVQLGELSNSVDTFKV